jgi:dGTPase
MDTTARAQEVVRDLFAAYLESPHEMNAGFAEQAASADGGPVRARAVADFIAGMTDRFAAREHERLTGRRLFD